MRKLVILAFLVLAFFVAKAFVGHSNDTIRALGIDPETGEMKEPIQCRDGVAYRQEHGNDGTSAWVPAVDAQGRRVACEEFD